VEKSVEKAQRTYIKLVLGILGGCILFVFLCWGAYRFYGIVESRHLARRAAAFLGGGDLRQAALSAQRALQLNPKSVAAIRVIAQVGEFSADRTALDWRRKAQELEPRSVDDALALAACALQFNDPATAEKTLHNVDETSRETAAFQVVAARLAEAKREPDEAENHWTKAVKLAPENKSYKLQFGLALLRTDNVAKRDAAVPMLEQLRSDEKQRAAATRALIMDGAAHRADAQRLRALALELQNYPEAKFGDRILYLEILRQLHDPNFTEYLTNLEKDAVAKPADLGSLFSWMTANGMSLLAIDFAHTLPNDELAKWPVPLAMAEAHAKLADWMGLEACVKNGSWGQFDFLRRAYFSLALREQDKPVAAGREWTSAQKEASGQAQYLSTLARAASDWGWRGETLELLWLLTKHPEKQFEALHELYQRYADAGDTPGLYRVLVRLAEVDADDLRSQNNLAQISLLLKVDVERAKRLAAELYRKEGSNPAYASTYAFALYTNGDINGALKVMNGLSESQLLDPSVAAYYGVVLAAAGDKTRAGEFLELAGQAKLLPEEKDLVAKAKKTLQ
jgi:predicted Zn-dependent protease